MDETILAAQYAQTGDLMDLCHNEAWLRESAAIEEEESSVEVGLAMKAYSNSIRALTGEQSQQLRQQMQIQSILFTTLQRWMESWQLGAGFDETYAIARRLVRQHLANLDSTQQAALDKLLGADREIGQMSQSTQPPAMSILSAMFTPDDWQTMAETASRAIASQVLSASQMQAETTADRHPAFETRSR